MGAVVQRGDLYYNAAVKPARKQHAERHVAYKLPLNSVGQQIPRFLNCFSLAVTVFVSFKHKPSKEEILQAWKEFAGVPQEMQLPSAPKQFLNYFEENDRPQAKLDRNLEGGMAVSIGRLREDTQYDYKFVCLSHNTLRGAAGGAVLLAELLAAKGYFD